MERNDREAVVEVFAEAAGLDFCAEVLVRSGDDAHVHGEVLVAADAGDAVFLECAEDFCLGSMAHVPDFVEEKGAAFRLLEFPAVLLDCACEGAFLVAKKFTLNQLRRDCRAVDLHEGAGGAAAGRMESARDKFLAGAVAAGNQDAGFGGGDLIDHRHEFAEGRAFADDAAGGLFSGGAAQPHRLADEGVLGQGVAHGYEDAVEVEGFGNEIKRPFPDGLHGGFDRPVPADHDHGRRHAASAQQLEHVDAVHPGHFHVAEHQIVRLRARRRHPLPTVARVVHLVPFVLEDLPQTRADRRLVVND